MNAVAAPATVERRNAHPNATGKPGRRMRVGREPGNLPSRVVRPRAGVGAGCGASASGDQAEVAWTQRFRARQCKDRQIAHKPATRCACACCCSLAFALSFLLGPANFDAGALFDGLFNGTARRASIAREIRLPRAALALCVGAALGASGAALQGLFRNPLAEPGVTGVTSSAGLGAVIALYFGLAAVHPVALPAFAIAGALVSAGILYLLSRGGAGAMALVLAGVAIASLATALTALALSLAPNPYAMSEMVLLDDGLAEGPHAGRSRLSPRR